MIYDCLKKCLLWGTLATILLSCNSGNVHRSGSACVVEFLLIIPSKENRAEKSAVVRPTTTNEYIGSETEVIAMNQRLAHRLLEGFRVGNLGGMFTASEDSTLFTTVFRTDKEQWIWYLDCRHIGAQDIVLRVVSGTSQKLAWRATGRESGAPISLSPGRYLVTATHGGEVGSVSIESFGGK